jgi:hypothetical protein
MMIMNGKEQGRLNRKTLCAILISLLLVMSLAFWTQSLVPALASSAQSYKVVQITFPRPGIYDSNLLKLDVTFSVGELKYTLTYTLDGSDEGSIPWTVNNPNNELHVVYEAIGSVNMPELSEGPHHIVVTLQVDVHQNGPNPPNGAFKPISPGSLDYQAIWTDTVDFIVEPINTPDTQPLPTETNYISDSIPQPSISEAPNNSMPQPTFNQVPLTKTSTFTAINILIVASTVAAALVVTVVSLFILKRSQHLKSKKETV